MGRKKTIEKIEKKGLNNAMDELFVAYLLNDTDGISPSNPIPKPIEERFRDVMAELKKFFDLIDIREYSLDKRDPIYPYLFYHLFKTWDSYHNVMHALVDINIKLVEWSEDQPDKSRFKIKNKKNLSKIVDIIKYLEENNYFDKRYKITTSTLQKIFLYSTNTRVSKSTINHKRKDTETLKEFVKLLKPAP